MGLLLVGTAPFRSALRETARVLRPEGLLSIASWTDAVSNPYTGIAIPVLRAVLPEATVPHQPHRRKAVSRPTLPGPWS
jgi:hypothetical protein